jgi:hypothetical protein
MRNKTAEFSYLRSVFTFCTRVLLVAALAASMFGCVAWTQDSQGNLRSIGLPGLPVWTAKPAPSQAPLPTYTDANANQLAHNERKASPWLDELNNWRRTVGLQPVAENLELSDGSRAHAEYILETARKDGANSVGAYGMVIGAALHHEDPNSPYFTEVGAQAAGGGRRVPGVSQAANIAFAQKSPKADIDSLLLVPFHRLSLLAPWAEVAGYGNAGNFPERVGTLALRGRQGRNVSTAIEFPPDGSSVPFGTMSSPEWPNPLAACPGYRAPVGLPITLQLSKQSSLGTYSLTDLTSGHELIACAFDATTYENPDAGQQAYVRRALSMYNGVVLIPRNPLDPGHRYRVVIEAGGSYQWSFEVARVGAEMAIREDRSTTL